MTQQQVVKPLRLPPPVSLQLDETDILWNDSNVILYTTSLIGKINSPTDRIAILEKKREELLIGELVEEAISAMLDSMKRSWYFGEPPLQLRKQKSEFLDKRQQAISKSNPQAPWLLRGLDGSMLLNMMAKHGEVILHFF